MAFLKKIVLSSMLTCSALWASELEFNNSNEIISVQQKINELKAKIKSDQTQMAILKWKDSTYKSEIEKLQEKIEEWRIAKARDQALNEREQALKEQALLDTIQNDQSLPLAHEDTNLSPTNRVLPDAGLPNTRVDIKPSDSLALIPYNNGYASPSIAPSYPNEQYRSPSSINPNIPHYIKGSHRNHYDLPTVPVPSDIYRHEEPLVAEQRFTKAPFLALKNGEEPTPIHITNENLTDNISVTEEDIRNVLSGKSSYPLNQNTIYCFIYNGQLYSLVPSRDDRSAHAGFTRKKIGSLVASKSKPSELYFKMNDKIEVIVYPNRSKVQMQMSFLDLLKVGLNAFNSDCCPGEQFKFQFVQKADLQSH